MLDLNCKVCRINVQLKVSMFDMTTLVRDEIGEDYALKVISDVSNDNMTIVGHTCTISHVSSCSSGKSLPRPIGLNW